MTGWEALGRDSLGVVSRDLVRGTWRDPGRKVKEVGTGALLGQADGAGQALPELVFKNNFSMLLSSRIWYGFYYEIN